MGQSFDSLLTEWLAANPLTPRKANQKPANGGNVVALSKAAREARKAYSPALGAPCTLMRGDAVEMMKTIADGSVDCIITDPPYGVTKLAWDCKIDLVEMWNQFRRITKPNAAIVVFGAGLFMHNVITANIGEFHYKYYWIKNRPSGVQYCKLQPMKKIEEISVFYRKPPEYHPPQVLHENGPRQYVIRKKRSEVYGGMGFNRAGEKFVSDFKTQTNVLQHDVVEKQLMHTQKPLDLMKFFINTYTSPGDTCLDSFMGSGTTGVACRDMGRKFIGIERDENHFLIATNRIYSKSKIEIKNVDDEIESNVVEFCAA